MPANTRLPNEGWNEILGCLSAADLRKMRGGGGSSALQKLALRNSRQRLTMWVSGFAGDLRCRRAEALRAVAEWC